MKVLAYSNEQERCRKPSVVKLVQKLLIRELESIPWCIIYMDLFVISHKSMLYSD